MSQLAIFLISLFFLSCSLTKNDRIPSSVERPPQFILMGFDGSESQDTWIETMSFANNNNIKFTYFVSGVFFVSEEDKNKYYREPRLGPGRSAIGWGKGEDDISTRYRLLKEAIENGHEIASHGNGHYTGLGNKDFNLPEATYDDWVSEFDQFYTIMTKGVQRYNVVGMPSWWNNYFQTRNLGYRAPQLDNNKAMYQALKDKGYKYDTSKVRKMSYWPQKINDIWDFALAGLRTSRTGKKVVSMDYNFYFRDSIEKKSSAAEWSFFEDQMYETYITYFKHNYFGNRAPLDIGHHFSQWNGGTYWKALKRFARTVCHKPEVRCVTYTELMNFLEETGSQKINRYQKGDFKKMSKAGVNLPMVPIKSSFGQSTELTESELYELRKALPPMSHGVVNTDIEI